MVHTLYNIFCAYFSPDRRPSSVLLLLDEMMSLCRWPVSFAPTQTQRQFPSNSAICVNQRWFCETTEWAAAVQSLRRGKNRWLGV